MRRLALLLWLLPGLAFGQTPAEKRAEVEQLLQALQAAPNSEAADALEERIQKLWFGGSTAAVTLLMQRGARELGTNAYETAIEAFSDAITLDPTLAEAWHQRGIARFQAGDRTGALADFRETLKLEPRNFATWKTLADIAATREDWNGAYAAWKKVMALDPKTRNGAERLRELRRKSLGEDT